QKLSDPDNALRVLNQYFSARWTDDSPFISIDITLHDGRVIYLESSAQQALMLPWRVGEAQTWNAEIPRALTGLLPNNAEPRLSDRALASAYVGEVRRDARHEIDDPEERCLHHDFLQ